MAAKLNERNYLKNELLRTYRNKTEKPLARGYKMLTHFAPVELNLIGEEAKMHYV